MNKTRLFSPKILVSCMCVLAFAAYIFFANEAKKEIYFLCKNFAAGHAFSDVVNQLDTITLSSFTLENTDTGKRITHSSALIHHRQSCTIEFKQQGEVVAVSLD